MRFLSFALLLLFVLSPSLVLSQSEEKEAFLFIDNKPTSSEEFIRLYQKNLDIITDEKQKDLDNYLELFITYKLKLIEAKEIGLDKKNDYLTDIAAYKKDLTLQYLEDSQVTKAIVEDLYQRSLKEIHASHILINLPTYAYGKDTVKAYEKINTLRERAVAGEDFNQLAQEYSEEPEAKKTKGDLGYFSTMQMVMSFEDAVYNTSINEVSPIIRTGFGYHILKVHDERSPENKLKAAHIIIRKSKDSLADKKRIQEAYESLERGEAFAEVVKKYSQDPATINNGGELNAFGRKGFNLPVFTEVAYNLTEGEYSVPFKTDLGWHIVLLIERLEQPSKEEKIKEIEKFLEVKSVSAYYDQKKHDKILSMLAYELLSDNYKSDLLHYIDRDYLLKNKEPIILPKVEDKKLFIIGEHSFYYNDFLNYLGATKQYATEGMPIEQLMDNALENYKKEKALEIYADKLYKEDIEYAAELDEYSDGILLFDLMQDQVWRKASKDTLAQKEYYKKHQRDFDLPESWEVLIYETKDKSVAQAIQEKLKSNLDKETINKEFEINPAVETWSKNSKELKSNSFDPAKTLSIIKEEDIYRVVELLKYIPQTERDFETAKNDVTQAYVVEYEEEWLQALREKHKVKLKKKKWKKLKSELL